MWRCAWPAAHMRLQVIIVRGLATCEHCCHGAAAHAGLVVVACEGGSASCSSAGTVWHVPAGPHVPGAVQVNVLKQREASEKLAVGKARYVAEQTAGGVQLLPASGMPSRHNGCSVPADAAHLQAPGVCPRCQSSMQHAGGAGTPLTGSTLSGIPDCTRECGSVAELNSAVGRAPVRLQQRVMASHPHMMRGAAAAAVLKAREASETSARSKAREDMLKEAEQNAQRLAADKARPRPLGAAWPGHV